MPDTTDAAPHKAHQTRLVCFFLHGQEYGAPIAQVKETLTLKPITRVFLVEPWIAGIINLRGDIVAVLDLALRLGMPQTEATDESRILVAKLGDRRAGILVDRVASLRDANIDELQPPPPTLSQDAQDILLGIATVEDGAPLRVLDLSTLFERSSE